MFSNTAQIGPDKAQLLGSMKLPEDLGVKLTKNVILRIRFNSLEFNAAEGVERWIFEMSEL